MSLTILCEQVLKDIFIYTCNLFNIYMICIRYILFFIYFNIKKQLKIKSNIQ